jgi:hypothetical protein
LLISVVALVLAFRGVDWGELLDALRGANYLYMVPAAVTLLAAMAARAERWRWLLGAREGVSYARSFRAISIGYLMTNVLPFRLGELVRPVVISRGGKVKALQAFSTIAVEHVLDVLIILAMLAVVLPDLPLPPVVAQGARLSAIVFGGAAAAMLLMVIGQQPAERAARWLLDRIPFLHTDTWLRRFNSALAGLSALRQPRLFIFSSAWSVIAWLASAVSFYFGMFAFMPEASFTSALFITITSTLVLLVPSTPGYIGVIEWAIRDSLLIFGVGPEVGLAYAIGYHFMEVVVMNVSGVASLIAEGMTWSMAVSEARQAETGQRAIDLPIAEEQA